MINKTTGSKTDKKRIVSFDLDMTLLDQATWKIPDSAIEAVEMLRKDSIIVIASGRAYDTLPKEVLDIQGIGWAITSNGAAVYRLPQGEAAFRSTLPPEAAKELLDCTAEENVSYETFVAGHAYTDKKMYDDPMAYGCTEYGAKYLRATRKPVPDIRDFILEHHNELDSIELVTRGKAERDRLWQVLEQRFPDLYITSSFFHLLELSSPHSGKRNALGWVLNQLGLTPEETVAFGNADNDIDMIQMAGIGVAVADATESCRKAADRCTGASYESGVAQALRELLQ